VRPFSFESLGIPSRCVLPTLPTLELPYELRLATTSKTNLKFNLDSFALAFNLPCPASAKSKLAFGGA